jgi:hypothetical protein
MKTPRLLLLMVLVIVAGGLLTSGCAGSGDHMDLADPAILPDDVRSAPDSVQEAYLFAVAHPEDLSHQPCYCGCGPMGHESNLGCFVSDFGDDGSVVFDSHATGCGICVDIAQDTMRMTADGKTPLEIRQFIDDRYGKFGPPTPTPMPIG